jgi:hypothetical protein
MCVDRKLAAAGRSSKLLEKGKEVLRNRVKKNAKRNEKDKELRLRNRIASLLQAILRTPQNDWTELVLKDNYDFSISSSDVNLPQRNAT